MIPVTAVLLRSMRTERDNRGNSFIDHLNSKVEKERSAARLNQSWGLLPWALLVAVAVERPLKLLALNLDAGVRIPKLAIHAAVVLAVAAGLTWVGRRIRLTPLAAGLAAAVICLVAQNWQQIFERVGWAGPLLLIPAILIIIRLPESLLAGAVFVLAVMLAGAPVVQLVEYSLTRGASMAEGMPALAGANSGRTEDIVVVILDEFAGLAALDELSSYDSHDFREELEADGLTVPDLAWSSATTTFISVSEMLEMRGLLGDGSVVTPATDRALYDIMSGDNRFVATLKGAGFTYTHLESGWEGTECGPAVDRCSHAPWLDATAWELWRPTIAGPWLEGRFTHPFIHAGLEGAGRLPSLLAEAQENDRHDLVVAHILLPHSPFVLGPDCTVLNPGDRDLTQRESRYVSQVRCAESIALDVADSVAESTALLITSDHGTTITPRSAGGPQNWSDEEIAGRLNVFMAYRLPQGCDAPGAAHTVTAMAAVLKCAVDLDAFEPIHTFTVAAHQRAGERSPVYRVPEPRVADLRALHSSASDSG